MCPFPQSLGSAEDEKGSSIPWEGRGPEGRGLQEGKMEVAMGVKGHDPRGKGPETSPGSGKSQAVS